MKNLKSLSLLALLLAPVWVVAAGPASQAPAEVSKAQFLQEAEARFTQMDANKDGKITTDERRAQRPGRGLGASMPAEITKAQHMKFAEERFAALDTNKDGKVTLDERRAGRGGYRGHAMHHGFGASLPAEISKADHQKHAEAMFDAIDSNKDGKITTEERRAARDKFRAEHRGQGRGPGASVPAAK